MKIIGKILKIIGKIIGGFFALLFGFLALCVIVTLYWGGIQMSRGTVMDTLPTVPEDFVPEVRFCVYTDTHNNNKNVADALDTIHTLFENDEQYKGVDAVFGLGDFSSIGNEDNYEAYVNTLKEHEYEGTQLINILGNHEMKNKNAVEYFKKYFGYEPNTVTEINGFTFIAFSGSPSLLEWTFSSEDLKWLREQVNTAVENANGKPVFVMQHPHNFGTVYGSAVWCDPQLNPIYAGKTNIVNFSGHSHFPANDPRSINQSTYTSIGAGAMDRFELDKNYVVGHHPDGFDTAAEFLVAEADSAGRVRVRGYDLNSDTYFYDYFIENVNDRSTFAYTYKNLKAHDSAPVFAEDIKAECKKNENGEWVLSFPEAKSNYIVHHYNIVIKDANGKKVFKDTVVDDYYVIDDDDTADIRLSADTLTAGESYTAEVVAVSAYQLKSEKVTLSFAAGK